MSTAFQGYPQRPKPGAREIGMALLQQAHAADPMGGALPAVPGEAPDEQEVARRLMGGAGARLA